MNRLGLHAVAADTVFDGHVAHHHWGVLIDGAQIVWVGPQQELSADVPIQELPAGSWLAPGFIDVQVNGGGDVLFNDEPTSAGVARIVAAHRRYGTTALMPTLLSDTPEKMRTALQAVREQPAGVLGIHFEGPFLSPEKPGVHHAALLRCPTSDDFSLLASPQPGITLVTLAPEQVPAGFVSRLSKAGVRIALGHSMATFAQTKAALAEGMTGFTHLFNAMRPPSSREPGPIAAALESSNAWFGMIVDGAHVDPAMLRLALRGLAHPMLVTDAMPPAGGTRSTFRLYGRQIERSGEHCITEDGTFAGTALDMASAVRNCVRFLGVPLASALRYASYEPALFLGVADRLGRLIKGWQADMVAFDPDNMQILGTWVAGGWAESR
jgi:N-acetylglucosamine-6-phosphate deacetylase